MIYFGHNNLFSLYILCIYQSDVWTYFCVMYSGYISTLPDPCSYFNCKYQILQNEWEGEILIVDITYLYIYPTDALLL